MVYQGSYSSGNTIAHCFYGTKVNLVVIEDGISHLLIPAITTTSVGMVNVFLAGWLRIPHISQPVELLHRCISTFLDNLEAFANEDDYFRNEFIKLAGIVEPSLSQQSLTAFYDKLYR